MNKKIILSLISIFLIAESSYGYYNMATPLEGESIANNALQFNVLTKLYKEFAPKHPACFDYKVINTQVIHKPYDVKKKNNQFVKGYWKELWTLEYCGTKQQFPVTFFINKKKTLFEIEI